MSVYIGEGTLIVPRIKVIVRLIVCTNVIWVGLVWEAGYLHVIVAGCWRKPSCIRVKIIINKKNTLQKDYVIGGVSSWPSWATLMKADKLVTGLFVNRILHKKRIEAEIVLSGSRKGQGLQILWVCFKVYSDYSDKTASCKSCVEILSNVNGNRSCLRTKKILLKSILFTKVIRTNFTFAAT